MNSITDQIRLALHHIWHNRWLALGTAWGICLAGWLVVSMVPNRYESKARIFVQLQSLLPDKIGMDDQQRQQGVDRVRDTLTSTVSLKKVVLGTSLKNTVSSDQDVLDAVDALRKTIKVDEKQDNLFEITATSARSGYSDAGNARLSTEIVQKLINLFEEENLSGNRTETGESLRFLDNQIDERGKALQAADQKRAEFEQKYLGVLPGSGSLEQRVAMAQQELEQVNGDYASAQSGLSALNGQLAGTPATVTTPGSSYYVPGAAGGGAGPAHAQVAQIEGQIAAGHARGWTDNYPDMASLRGQLAAARAAAAHEPAAAAGSAGGMHNAPGVTTANPTYAALISQRAEKQAAFASASARRSQLMEMIAQAQAVQTSQPGVAAQQAQLNRDYDVEKAEYDKLLQNREEIRLRGQIQDQTSAVKFRVIDPPALPHDPTAPNRPMLLAAVLLVGILGGLGAAYARSRVVTTYPSLAHLAKASGLPVIGAISRVTTVEQRAQDQKYLKYFQAGTAALGGVFVLLLLLEFIERSMVA